MAKAASAEVYEVDHHELEHKIDDLESQVSAASHGHGSWGEVWATIRGIRDAFRETRFPSREQREQAWQRFQGIVSDVQAQREERERERQEAARWSEAVRDEIIYYAETGGVFDLADFSGSTFGQAEAAAARMRLEGSSARLREAWRKFNYYKGKMLGQHKREVFEHLTEVGAKLDEAWQAWHDARTQEQITRTEEYLERKQSQKARREDHRRGLLSKLSGPGSDSYLSRVEDWIAEEDERIREIDDNIRNAEERLNDLRNRLR